MLAGPLAVWGCGPRPPDAVTINDALSGSVRLDVLVQAGAGPGCPVAAPGGSDTLDAISRRFGDCWGGAPGAGAERNRIQGILLAVADARCDGARMVFGLALDRLRGLSPLGVGGPLVDSGGVGQNPATGLSDLILGRLEAARKGQRAQILGQQTRPIDEYSLKAAVVDAVTYDSVCDLHGLIIGSGGLALDRDAVSAVIDGGPDRIGQLVRALGLDPSHPSARKETGACFAACLTEGFRPELFKAAR